jgi:di/tricarboxylate transporter
VPTMLPCPHATWVARTAYAAMYSCTASHPSTAVLFVPACMYLQNALGFRPDATLLSVMLCQVRVHGGGWGTSRVNVYEG